MRHQYNFDSDIRIYNNVAFATSILQSRYPDYKQYFLCKLFKLKWRSKWKAPVFSFFHAFRWGCFQRKLHVAFSSKQLQKIICNQINEGYDLYVTLNEYYIQNRTVYQKRRLIHDMYIFGYDNEKRIYNTIAYNDKNKFEEQLICFDDLAKAMFSSCPILVFYSFKLKPQNNLLKNRAKIIKRNISKYVSPLSSKSNINLNTFIRKLLLNDKRRYLVDIRTFRIIMEHKLILSNLDNICGKSYGFNKLYEKSIILFYTAIRWYVLNDENKLTEVIDKLMELDIMEKECFQKLKEDGYEFIKACLQD